MSWLRSVRFRLALLSSALLVAVTVAVGGGIYLALARSVGGEPVTRTFRAVEGIRTPSGFKALRTIQVAEVSDIERAVNATTLASLRDYGIWALGGIFLTSLGIGWLLASRALRPVQTIAATAQEVQAGDLSRRVELHGDDEFGTLGGSIDAMLTQIEDTFTTQRRFVDDASHELRTPLAVIRTNIDTVLSRADAPAQERERAVATVDRAVDRMTRLVEELLASARQDAPLERRPGVPLGVLLREEVEEFTDLAATRDLSLLVEVDGAPAVHADAEVLRRAVDNLLSNAVRLAPTGSAVTGYAGRLGEWAFVGVRDGGPGIAAADQRRVFDRFWRSPAVDGGEHNGLGLAIVRQSALSHGGVVRLASAPGVGSDFVLWLPVGASRPSRPAPEASPLPPR